MALVGMLISVKGKNWNKFQFVLRSFAGLLKIQRVIKEKVGGHTILFWHTRAALLSTY